MNSIKSLSEYLPPELSLSVSTIPVAMGHVVAAGDKDVKLSEKEIAFFMICYDQVLPWDWNRRNFRGITLHKDFEY